MNYYFRSILTLVFITCFTSLIAQKSVVLSPSGLMVPKYSNVNQMISENANAQIGQIVFNESDNSFYYFMGFWQKITNQDDNIWGKNNNSNYLKNNNKIGIGTYNPAALFHLNKVHTDTTPLLLYTRNLNDSVAFIDYRGVTFFKYNVIFQSAIGFRSNNQSTTGFLKATDTSLVLNTNFNNIPLQLQTGLGGVTLGSPSKYNAAKLNVGGYIRSEPLKFTPGNFNTEKIPVFTNANGVLVKGYYENQYYSVNFSMAQAQNYSDQLMKGSGYAWLNTTNTPGTIYVPISFQQGALLLGMRVYYYDNSNSDFTFTFYKNDHDTNNFSVWGSASSSGASGMLRYSDVYLNQVVDPGEASFYLNVSSSGNWTGNSLKFHSVVFKYNYY